MTAAEVIETVAAMPREECMKVQAGIAELFVSRFSPADAAEIRDTLAEADAKFARGEKLTTTDDFSSDRPIASAKEDRLGREPFANGLADRIRAWGGHDSLVLALCGKWGCGKTSLKNMVLERLTAGKNPKVDLMEFNPWEISGRGMLAATFFRELAFLLTHGKGPDAKSSAAARRLNQYSKLASFSGTVMKWIGTGLTMIKPAEGAVVAAAGEAVSQTAEIAKQGADAQADSANPDEQSLSDLKRALAKDMAKLERPIVIVIDDIDRLTTDEIREVFQLVKANADFRNLIYLLMFDREIVSGALDTISGNRGDEFLGKIVQVLFHVPEPPIAKVHQVLFDALNRHLASPEIGERWDKARWNKVWPDGLSSYFENLRSVYRFLGSFSFHVALMRSKTSFELNLVDLVALEALRQFEPALYEALPSNRAILLGSRNRMAYLNEKEIKEEAQAEIARLLSLVPQTRRERVREILRELFPALFGRHNPTEEYLLRGLRVGHKDIFDRYFTMALAADDLSQADVDALRATIAKPAEFAKACWSLEQRGLVTAVFERLDAYKQTFPKTDFPHLITSLADVGDSLPQNFDGDIFGHDALVHAWRIIYFGLKDMQDEGERFAHLRAGIAASTGVRLSVQIAVNEERRNDQSDFLVSEPHAEELKTLAIERIRAAASDGRLKNLKGLLFVLYRWREWTDENEVKAWAISNTVTAADAVWILKTNLSTMRITSSKVTLVRYIKLEDLACFADVATIERLTTRIELSKLSGDEMRALRAFRWALTWKSEGKPDGYWGDDLGDKNPLAEES